MSILENDYTKQFTLKSKTYATRYFLYCVFGILKFRDEMRALFLLIKPLYLDVKIYLHGLVFIYC